jgi:hypothetical protein
MLLCRVELSLEKRANDADVILIFLHGRCLATGTSTPSQEAKSLLLSSSTALVSHH